MKCHNLLWFLDWLVCIDPAQAKQIPQNHSGGLPYLGAAATTVYLARQAQLAASDLVSNIDPGVALTVLDQALNLQVTYGAVMLSFLGKLLLLQINSHWLKLN